MKAILINSLFPRGAERIVLNIVTYLKSNNKDILLIVLNKTDKEYDVENVNVIYLGKDKDLSKGISLGKMLIYPVLLYRLIQLIKKEKIDLIQSHLFTSSSLNVFSKLLGCKHKIQVVNHSLVSYEKQLGLIGKIKTFIISAVYKKADIIISISNMMRYDIEKNIIRNSATVKNIVIPNPHNINEVVEKSLCKVDDFVFNNSKQYIITSGYLEKRKRIDLLIRSFSKLHDQFDNYELIILGDGAERESLTLLAEELNCTDVIHFLGFVKNPFKYIAKSDMYVLASEMEGLPNSLIEALICKIPVVSSDCKTGPREILAPGTDFNFQLKDNVEICDYGILFPPNNMELLLKAMVIQISEFGQIKERPIKAFDYVQKYEQSRIMKKYQEVIFSE